MEERGYSVIRCMGQGSQGRVYEVRDSNDRPRVVKQLPWNSEVNREDALREVRLLSALRHPCIVPYLENFLVKSSPSLPSEDVLCLVMSRCEHDLREECTRCRSGGSCIEESRALSWLAQLCWGLQHLHSRKFLHRDLKPQNVLLTQSRRVLLADFGVACHLERTEDLRSTRVGTFVFMSPEMLEGRPYGRKTDQWALGCVLFEILVLEPPFANASMHVALNSAVAQALARIPHCYNRELRHTVKLLLPSKPDDRPSNHDLLRSPLLRAPFHSFVQSLEAAAKAAAAAIPNPENSPSTGLTTASGRVVDGSVTTSMCDFLHHVLPSPSTGHNINLPETTLHGLPMLHEMPSEEEIQDEAIDAWQQSLDFDVHETSLESDFENYLGTSPLTSRSQTGSHTETYTDSIFQTQSTMRSESGLQMPIKQEQSFPLGSSGLAASEWRQLLDEAESLLKPEPEAKASAVNETEKLRKALNKVLGSDEQVQRAVKFLRERQPLGETEEADELLLQVEILDLLGDEGVHALPLLERYLLCEFSLPQSEDRKY